MVSSFFRVNYSVGPESRGLLQGACSVTECVAQSDRGNKNKNRAGGIPWWQIIRF